MSDLRKHLLTVKGQKNDERKENINKFRKKVSSTSEKKKKVKLKSEKKIIRGENIGSEKKMNKYSDMRDFFAKQTTQNPNQDQDLRGDGQNLAIKTKVSSDNEAAELIGRNKSSIKGRNPSGLSQMIVLEK